MYWWAWVVIGVLLLGAELFFMDVAFYFVFLGAAAVITGLLNLGLGLDLTGQLAMYAALTITTTILFRKKLYLLLKNGGEGADFEQTFVGGAVEIMKAMEAGERGRVIYRGTEWNALNTSDEELEGGSIAVIYGLNNMVLEVGPKQRRQQG